MTKFEEWLAKKTDKELKEMAARAIENFIHWGQSGTDEQFEEAEATVVKLLDEVKRRRL